MNLQHARLDLLEFPPETQAKLKKQIEFYFSDSNLPRDVFMADQIAADPEGFVDLALLCTFKRMRDILGVKEEMHRSSVPHTMVEMVGRALQGCESLTLSEDKKRVRRTVPLTSAEDAIAQIDQRSLYASPFPFKTSLDAITEFFQKRAPVNCVRMRRHMESKDFRGSVFVEFADEAAAQKVLMEQLEYEGAPIHLEPKLDFVTRKKAERKSKAEEKKAGTAGGEEQVADVEDVAAPSSAAAAGNAEEAPVQAPEEEEAYEEGLLLGFDFGDIEHDLYFSNIKESLSGGNAGNIRYVEFQRGAPSGVVRYRAKDIIPKILESADSEGKLQIAGFMATIKKLEGEQEKAFYMRANVEKAARAAAGQEATPFGGGRGQKRQRGGGRGRGRGGGRHKRGRH